MCEERATCERVKQGFSCGWALKKHWGRDRRAVRTLQPAEERPFAALLHAGSLRQTNSGDNRALLGFDGVTSPSFPSRFSLSGTEPERSFRLSTKELRAVFPPVAHLGFWRWHVPMCPISVLFCYPLGFPSIDSAERENCRYARCSARLWRQLIALFATGPRACSFGSLFGRQMARLHPSTISAFLLPEALERRVRSEHTTPR